MEAENGEVKVTISNGNDMYEVFVQKTDLADVKVEESEPTFLASLLYYAAEKVMGSEPSSSAPDAQEHTEEGEISVVEDDGDGDGDGDVEGDVDFSMDDIPVEIVPMPTHSPYDYDDNEKNAYHWCDQAVFLLIDLVAANRDKFESAGLSQKKVWRIIAGEMLANGYSPNPDQCHSKWRSLKRSYKSMKAQSKRVANSRQEWPFMEALDSLVGQKSDALDTGDGDDDIGFDFLKPGRRKPMEDTNAENGVNALSGGCAGDTAVAGKRWTIEAAKHLICAYAKREKEFFSSAKPNREIWKEITEEIRTVDGIAFQPDQTENKWKNLKKMYKTIIVNRNKSGGGLIVWPFFNLMDQVLGRKREICPVSVASSSKGFSSMQETSSSSTSGDDESIETAPSFKRRKRRKRKQLESPKRRMKKEPEWFNELMMEKKRQHDEKMAALNEILEIVKEKHKKKLLNM